MKKTLGIFVLFMAASAVTSGLRAECAACGIDPSGTCATCAAADAELACAVDPACGCNACCNRFGFCGLEINGYLNAGGTFNDHSANYNYTHSNSNNEVGFDGAYISLLKKAQNGCGCVDWGFGADAMFGRDAKFFSSYKGWDDNWETGHYEAEYFNNSESYGFAAPQLYGEMSANYWTFKGGRFYTLLGYEGARADQRFFYTFGRNFEMTPITHTGGLATYNGFDNLDFTIGWVAGENNMFERDYDESLVTGAVKFHRGENASVKYAFLAGDGMTNGVKGTLFRNDVVLERKLNCRWDAALMFNYGCLSNVDVANSNQNTNYTGSLYDFIPSPGMWTVIDRYTYQTWAGYLYYKLNDCWKLGGRLEWQRGEAVGNQADMEATGMEFVSMTFGANWTPMCSDNFVVRPEVRYDKCVGTGPMALSSDCFGDFAKDDQISLGFDAMYMF